MNYYAVFCAFLLCFLVPGNSLLRHTNIGKFVQGIFGRIQNHTLTIPANQKLDVDILRQAFEGLRNVIDDPLIIKEQKLHYEMNEVIRLHGNTHEIQVRNFKNMSLDHVYISEDQLYSEVVVSVPLLVATGFYNVSCYLHHYDFNLHGNGTFKLELSNLKIKLNFTLDQMQTGYMQLHKVNLDQSIDSTKVEIHNLLNDEEVSSVISEIVTIVIPPLHSYFKPVINDFISRIIALSSEVVFGKMKFIEFVGLVYAFKEKSISNNLLAS